MTSEQSPDERRQHPRRDLRVPGVAYVLCESSLSPIEVWTRNVSRGGVSLISQTELKGERMMLQLSLPQFADKLVACRVRHRSRYDRLLINGHEDSTFVCGVQFEKVLAESEVHESLLAAFRMREDVKREAEAPAAEDESLMALLSAIGLAVVYASRLPVM